MKLYTEAEIISAYEKAELCHLSMESFIELMTPIKLPSDEEIWDKADEEDEIEKHYVFIRGAEWMRDKIQGGEQ